LDQIKNSLTLEKAWIKSSSIIKAKFMRWIIKERGKGKWLNGSKKI
jgi:hypothetical protein